MSRLLPQALLPQQDLRDVELALAKLQQQDLVARIWRGDHTIWKPSPMEITNRLGWLTLPAQMKEQSAGLKAFGQEFSSAGFKQVVVMGMGGSVQGARVLHEVLGTSRSYPQVIILDSPLPERLLEVTRAIDPARTLFLVASKSGGTIETSCLYSYFRRLVEGEVGTARAGQHFVAVTDQGSPLDGLAQAQAFRHIFLNPADVGGRFSVLSYFGLVPAALMGLDLALLLSRAEVMREGCTSRQHGADNPGAWLGALIATLALRGRDKLTLLTSPSLRSLASWIEQLIAESMGKEGKGIVPVASEPLLDSGCYGDDRFFIYLRLQGDDNAATDAAVDKVTSAGQPALRLELKDRYDIAAEFFRWQFATAVAGAIIGVNPFDQPDVQQAKELTAQVLQEYHASGKVAAAVTTYPPAQLLSLAGHGDYLAIMAYLFPAPEVEEVLSGLRRRVSAGRRIPTTLGYGPGLLHTTGQLHKGGPANGLFLQITAPCQRDVPIPGQPYTFGMLAEAQAGADLMALQVHGRRVAAVRLGRGDIADLRALAESLPS